MTDNIDTTKVGATPFKSYEWLTEDEKKKMVAKLLSTGARDTWVFEEAKRLGLHFLSEFYEEAEKGNL